MADMKAESHYGELDELEILVMCEDSVLYESPYLGQHGISLLVRARRQGTARSILMDVGQDPAALLENFKRLQVDPQEIDTIVITHCHYDHTQGLTEILRAVGRKGLREAGAELYLTTDPLVLMPGLFSTGEVARRRSSRRSASAPCRRSTRAGAWGRTSCSTASPWSPACAGRTRWCSPAAATPAS